MTGLLFGMMLVAGTADAADGRAAAREQRALEADLTRHAQRLSWPAVDDTYRRLMALERTLSDGDHVLGARAALHAGDAMLAWERLQRIEADDPEARGLTTSLQARYGFVEITVPGDRAPVLSRPHLPFHKHERAAVRVAVTQVAEARGYRGLLPEGVYVLDGMRFQVVPDWPAWKVVVAGDASTGDPEARAPVIPMIPRPTTGDAD